MSNISDLLKKTFSNVIQDYEYARPKYPSAIYDTICQFSGIKTGAAILEVGAGTGQATELFVDKDYQLDLLEVSKEQVNYLIEKYKIRNAVCVHEAYFEQYENNKKYDLIYSATAFHWIDSEIGYPKAWDMLKPGGTLAVFWQMSSVTYINTGIFQGLNQIKQKYMPNESLGYDEDGIQKVKEKRIRQIQSGGYFGEPEYHEYQWTDTYDAERYTALLNTYSSTQLLEEEVRKAYLEEVREYIKQNGGIVEMPQKVCLYLVRKGFLS